MESIHKYFEHLASGPSGMFEYFEQHEIYQMCKDFGLPASTLQWTPTDYDDYNNGVAGKIQARLKLTRPTATVMTEEDGVKEAKSRTTAIFESFSTLQDTLQKFEEIIRKRWFKKSNPQRMALLRVAWPNMPKFHRPDMRAIRREDKDTRKTNTRFREAYMWPHLNIEDLQSDTNMMRLLNARGRHTPASFTIVDWESIQLGYVTDALHRTYLCGYNMDMSGPTPDKYGNIIRCHPESRDQIQSDKLCSVNEGLKILEVQEHILEILVKFCKAILHDKSLIDDSVPVLPEPTPITISLRDLSAVSMAMTIPYGVPHKVNLETIRSLVCERLSDAEEHHWALREDPAYFADCARQWADHSTAMVLDEHGKLHPMLDKPKRKHWIWDTVIIKMVMESYNSILLWRFAAHQLAEVIRIDTKYDSDKRAPEYVREIKKLNLVVMQLANDIGLDLVEILPASPSMRRLFYRSSSDRRNIRGEPCVYPSTKSDPKDNIIWIWSQMSISLGNGNYGFETLTHEFERLLLDGQQRRRISALVASTISDIGLLGELRNQLRLYDPSIFRRKKDPNSVSREREEFKEWGVEFYRPIWELMRNTASKSEGALRLGILGDPTSGRFSYPVAKRRTKKNQEIMQQAENHLDQLWYECDKRLETRMTESGYRRLQDLVPKGRKLLRTEDWVEPEKTTKPVTDKTSTFSLDFGETGDQKPRYEAPTIRTKTKTKGSSKAPDDPPEQTTEAGPSRAANTAVTPPRFLVDWRAYKVFTVLFHQPLYHTKPREILWTDFLYAMGKIGLASRKLYGSVWQFKPSDTGVDADAGSGNNKSAKLTSDRSINFHEPHPEHRIKFHVARRHGRRLTRVYGIDGSNFDLA